MTTPASPANPLSEGLPAQLAGPLRSFLEQQVFPAWLPQRRWFRSKGRTILSVAFDAVIPCDENHDEVCCRAVLTILDVRFTDGAPERYALPIALVSPVTPDTESTIPTAAHLTPITMPSGPQLLIDGCWHAGFRAGFFEMISKPDEVSALGGSVRGLPGDATAMRERSSHPSRVLSAEQSNSSLIYGQGENAVFVKLYRRIEEGVHPEPEMLRFLREHTHYRHVPGFLSSLEWVSSDGQVFTAALAQEFLPEAEDAWDHIVTGIRKLKAHGDPKERNIDPALIALRSTAGLLGQRVAELHLATAHHTNIAAFTPEPFTTADAEAARAQARVALDAGLREVHSMLTRDAVRTPLREDALKLIDGREMLEARLRAHSTEAGTNGLKIRTHGDLHLGQILLRDEDVRILDFEGEPGRPLSAGREKKSPLRDVAGMLRSFHYAAHAAILLDDNRTLGLEQASPFDPDAVSRDLCAAFWAEYIKTVTHETQGISGLLPDSETARSALLDLFLLEKATYELQYECNNRPDWAAIPLRGLLALLIKAP